MATDNERREVARKLRELHLGGGSKDLIELTLSDAIGAWNDNGMSWDYITERLADLIEPEPERTCKNVNGFCSECGEQLDDGIQTYNYCAYCGAKVVIE